MASQPLVFKASELKQIQTSSQLIVAKLAHNYPLPIALGQLNSFSFPFAQITVDTTDAQVQMLARGANLLLATASENSINLVVRDKQEPQRFILLTLEPRKLKLAPSYQFLIPQLLREQQLLQQTQLSSSTYLAQLASLLRASVEQLQQGKVFVRGSESYSEQNFLYTQVPLSPDNLTLLELSKLQSYAPLTCGQGQLQVSKIREFQPQNPYYAGIQIKSFWLENISGTPLVWQASLCTQPNVLAAVLLSQATLYPAAKAKVVLLEQVSY
ncbi:hypothetical protein [Psittacicella gerlachiana]|nr:hypothetical protein [Psittacicella gerlachiana]